MLISLYTSPNCEQSMATRNVLIARGIAYTERSIDGHAITLDTKGFFAPPVVAFVAQGELVVWQGYRPDLLNLLADFLALGPVLCQGMQDITEAKEAVLTRLQVVEQISKHQLNVENFFADHGMHPLYRGAVLLDWLGY